MQHKTGGRVACCGPSTKDKQQVVGREGEHDDCFTSNLQLIVILPHTPCTHQAAQLMQSTETLMKFGFMSMSMTYFSSLNMIRAMRKVGATDTVMGALVKVTCIFKGYDPTQICTTSQCTFFYRSSKMLMRA